MRRMSSRVASARSTTVRRPMSIGHSPRREGKPECISAAADRPRARLWTSLGHSPASGSSWPGQVFADRQGIPDRQIAVTQHRHPARRRMPADLFGDPGLAQGDQGFAEGRACPLQRQPRAHRPARPFAGADNEFHAEHPSIVITRLMAHSPRLRLDRPNDKQGWAGKVRLDGGCIGDSRRGGEGKTGFFRRIRPLGGDPFDVRLHLELH